MMNVRVLQERPSVIRMGSVRSAVPVDKATPKVASPKGAQPKVASPPKGTQTKCSPQQQKSPQHKIPFNSNVCFLCGKEGHYGSQTSCHAANRVRKAYFN